MNKLIIFTVIFIIFLIIVIPVSLSVMIRFIPSGTQPPLRDTEKIYGSFILTQKFISDMDNLAGIGVSIKNPNYKNKKEVKIKIFDSEDKLIRSVILNGQNIADGEFVKIMFDPISDSKKVYSWSIESGESTVEDALEIFLTDQKPPWSLEFKVGKSEANYGLSYVTFHKVKPLVVLNKVFSGWFTNLFSDRSFFVFYVSTILIIISSLLYLNFSDKKA